MPGQLVARKGGVMSKALTKGEAGHERLHGDARDKGPSVELHQDLPCGRGALGEQGQGRPQVGVVPRALNDAVCSVALATGRHVERRGEVGVRRASCAAVATRTPVPGSVHKDCLEASHHAAQDGQPCIGILGHKAGSIAGCNEQDLNVTHVVAGANARG